MPSFESRIRRPFQRLPRFAIAGITAILLGLPSVAGAVSLHAKSVSWGDASAPRDVSLSFRDLHAEFVERAAHDFECDLPPLPSLGDSFERARFRRGHGAGPPIDGLPDFPWLDGDFGGNRALIAAALALRHFCPIKPPPQVPEPGTAVLLAGGLIALSLWSRRRRA